MISVLWQPTVTASSAYSANMIVGDAYDVDIDRANFCGIRAVELVISSNQSADFDLIFAERPFSAAVTDRSALDLSNDLVRVFHATRLRNPVALKASGPVIYSALDNVDVPLTYPPPLTLILVTRGTPTFTTTTDVTLRLALEAIS